MSNRIVDLLDRAPAAPRGDRDDDRAKRELHRALVASLDLTVVQSVPREDLRDVLRDRLTTMVHARDLAMTSAQQADAVEDILDEVLGYGPLERLLRLTDITDILVNGPDTVYIERRGKLEQAEIRFRDNDHLRHVINRIVGGVGRRIDESTPMVDARLPDGSRINAVIPPVTLDGPMLSIRRFGTNPIRRDDLVEKGALPEPVMRFLEQCVHARLNILISGGTGSGKTTLLNALSAAIPDDERIVTIEDAAELRLQQRHVVRMETRPPNLEKEGEITARMLVKNALRMRPDRIILGEIRSEEAIDMLQAMNTGHDGSLGTLHANSPHHALTRLQSMVGISLGNMPAHAIREMISDAVHLVIQVSRLRDGTRRVVAITEITGMKGGEMTTTELFVFHQTTVDSHGRVHGYFAVTDTPPAVTERLEADGLVLPDGFLGLRVEV